MRTIAAVVLAGLLLGGLYWVSTRNRVQAGEDVAIAGKMSCTACKLAGGPERTCTKECCQGCIKGGDSALLEDAGGKLYLLIGRDKEKPVLSEKQLDLLGEQVTVTGILTEKGGLKGIYVESIEQIPLAASAEDEEVHPE